MKQFFNLLAALFFIGLVTGCGDKDETMRCIGDFDQEPFLMHVANQLIIPGYTGFRDGSSTLLSELTELQGNLDKDQLSTVQDQFTSTYLDFQKIAQYSFGPAEDISFRSNINNFPLNVEEFKETLNSGNFDFNSPARYDKGFPALDYILFGTGATKEAIVDSLNNDSRLLEYAIAIARDMNQKSIYLVDSWSTFQTDFIANQGTDAGSSLSQIVNGLNENFEITKRDRIGIPSGELTLNFPNPDKVEAPYSGISNELIIESVNASKNLFLGTASGVGPSLGLDDILDHVDAKKRDEFLSTLIESTYNELLAQVESFQNPLQVECVSNTANVVEAYRISTTQVVQTKTDMTSEMCITITYVDSPSDTD